MVRRRSIPANRIRKSNNGKITLVIVNGVEPIPVLWSELDVGSGGVEFGCSGLAFAGYLLMPVPSHL